MRFEIPAERSKIFDDFVRSYFPLYMETIMKPTSRPTPTAVSTADISAYFALISVDGRLLALHTTNVQGSDVVAALLNNPGSRLVHVSDLDDLFQEMYR